MDQQTKSKALSTRIRDPLGKSVLQINLYPLYIKYARLSNLDSILSSVSYNMDQVNGGKLEESKKNAVIREGKGGI